MSLRNDLLPTIKLPNGLYGYDLNAMGDDIATDAGFIDRRYNTPEGYLNSSYILRGLAVSALGVRKGSVRQDIPSEFAPWVEGMVAMGVAEFGTQIYWLGGELGTAFTQTEPPRDNEATFDSLPMPYPAYLTMLKKGTLRIGQDGHIMAITQCLFGPEFSERYFQKVLGERGGAQSMFYSIGFCFYERDLPGRPSIVTYFFRGWGSELMARQILDPDPERDLYLPAGFEKGVPDSQVDTLAPRAIAQVAVNTSIVITTLPQLLEESEPLGKNRKGGKGGKKRPQLLSARWVGKSYKYPHRDTPGGKHASPHMHYRRGHWRMQRYGAGRKAAKRIWIEPTIINAPGA